MSHFSAFRSLSLFNAVEQTSGNRGKEEIDASAVLFLLSKPDCSSLSDEMFL